MSKCRINNHDNCIDNLVRRLESSGRYHPIFKDTFYKVQLKGETIAGAPDVFAVRYARGGRTAFFFEVKSQDNAKARRRAQAQLEKHYKIASRTFNNVYMYYVYPINRRDYILHRHFPGGDLNEQD